MIKSGRNKSDFESNLRLQLPAIHMHLLFSLQQLTILDTIFARGKFGKSHQCSIAELSDEFHLKLIDARHPLLEAALKKENKNPVPVSVDMPPDKKALVVTGPNTGGKTVFLKTAGLLTLMAHHALPIPAAEGTIFPIVTSIEADIGDQQSISESLSTFSSHIRNIRNILEHVQQRSLVLLDELGTGTDPEEGAPLAVAILQEFLNRDTKTLITSHHSQMKMFAFNHPQCLTAAMEFDQNNLQPTYRVHLIKWDRVMLLKLQGVWVCLPKFCKMRALLLVMNEDVSMNFKDGFRNKSSN